VRKLAVSGVRAGTSMVELLVALLLLALVIQSAWALLARQRTVGARIGMRAEALETIRTLAWLLPEEADGIRPAADWDGVGTDSLTLRAFRGVGLPLPYDAGVAPAEDQIRVCFRGIRSPNPDKDSILILGADGRWRIHGLRWRARREADCSGLGGGREEDWWLDPPPGEAVLSRVFERGTYYLAGEALRYRRGDGGRQPLTPLRIRSGGFLDLGEGAVSWSVTLAGAGMPLDSALWRGRIR